MLYLYVLLVPVIVVLSWIVSIYDPRVVSLLGIDGLGWFVTSTLHNISQAPIGILTVALIACSSASESGLLSPNTSLKRRRALMVSVIITSVFLALVLGLLFVPGNPLYSPFGGFAGSPLYYVLPALTLLSVILCGTTYGYMMGRATSVNDMLQMHLFHIREHAVLFPLFLVSAEIGEMLTFSHLDTFCPSFVLTFLLYLIPVIHEMIIKSVFGHKKKYQKVCRFTK